MIEIITVNYQATDWIAQLLVSLQAQEDADWRLIIVNNSPPDDRLKAWASARVVLLEMSQNLGFGAACNRGLAWVYGYNPQAIVWLLNPDTQLPPTAIWQAHQEFQAHPDRSILGTVVTEPNGVFWFAGGRFLPQAGTIVAETTWPSTDAYQSCAWVTGCSLLLNLAQFATCPQFDPDYFLYYEDFDFCRRYAEAGHSIGITRLIQVIHHPSAITDRQPQHKFQHSTYSYLITLERYASKLALSWRLLRLVLHAIVLFPRRPAVAWGKLQGILHYFVRTIRGPFPIG